MNRNRAARSQHEPGATWTEETEDGAECKTCASRKRKAPWPEATTPDQEPVTEAPREAGSLPPPHPALVELVRLLARADARRARAEEKETW